MRSCNMHRLLASAQILKSIYIYIHIKTLQLVQVHTYTGMVTILPECNELIKFIAINKIQLTS